MNGVVVLRGGGIQVLPWSRTLLVVWHCQGGTGVYRLSQALCNRFDEEMTGMVMRVFARRFEPQTAFKLTRASSFAASSFRSLYRSVRYPAAPRVSSVNLISSSITSTTRS